MADLCATTAALLDRGECTGMELAHTVGQWTWAALVRRPSLAVLSSVYRFIARAGHRCWQLWPTVRRELSVLMGVAPLLRTSLRAPVMPYTIATDASLSGWGVVATLGTVRSNMSATLCMPTADVDDVITAQWTTALSAPWRRPEHINALELRAVEAGVRWAVLTMPSLAMHARLPLLVDSSVALGVLLKGRSSSPTLLRRARAIAATALAANLYLKPSYIMSIANPADEPSRGI
jgi:hypothetical protein